MWDRGRFSIPIPTDWYEETEIVPVESDCR